MNTKTLGILALLGAPFLCINTLIHVQDGQYHTTPLSGLLGLLYMSGWMCSIVGLRRLGATGNDRFGRLIVSIILGTLTLANIWNVYEMVLPDHNTILYRILDAFWPISNVVMIGVGIAVIRAKRLTGWQRYAPLACGLWLPATILVSITLNEAGFYISNSYTAIAWTLLALVVLTSKEPVLEANPM